MNRCFLFLLWYGGLVGVGEEGEAAREAEKEQGGDDAECHNHEVGGNGREDAFPGEEPHENEMGEIGDGAEVAQRFVGQTPVHFVAQGPYHDGGSGGNEHKVAVVEACLVSSHFQPCAHPTQQEHGSGGNAIQFHNFALIVGNEFAYAAKHYGRHKTIVIQPYHVESHVGGVLHGLGHVGLVVGGEHHWHIHRQPNPEYRPRRYAFAEPVHQRYANDKRHDEPRARKSGVEEKSANEVGVRLQNAPVVAEKHAVDGEIRLHHKPKRIQLPHAPNVVLQLGVVGLFPKEKECAHHEKHRHSHSGEQADIERIGFAHERACVNSHHQQRGHHFQNVDRMICASAQRFLSQPRISGKRNMLSL